MARTRSAGTHVSRRLCGVERTRLPGAGLLSLAFFVLAGLWTKARGFLAR